jgi:hypothetical protein
MAGIQDFVFEKDRRELAWAFEGERVQPAGGPYEQAVLDTVNDLVLALEAGNGLPERLHVFSGSGKEVASLGPPQGFQFYYLTRYPKLGAAVVCVAPEPVDGWRDWHFGFDRKSSKLFRHAPAH